MSCFWRGNDSAKDAGQIDEDDETNARTENVDGIYELGLLKGQIEEGKGQDEGKLEKGDLKGAGGILGGLG